MQAVVFRRSLFLLPNLSLHIPGEGVQGDSHIWGWGESVSMLLGTYQYGDTMMEMGLNDRGEF